MKNNKLFKKIQFIITKFKSHTLRSIEKEIIENQKRLSEIEYTLREEYDGNEAGILEHEKIEIKKYDKILNLRRQHKLDRKNGWVSRFICSILVPIIIAVIISLLVNN